ncbi:unnamed protein product [Polarella glacialis]|uniref:Uncharacterized protein n=1 Tax=Polarella glacialis TaxID=89957 RepID=A0A813D8Z6_POLGL|nr:unnamed protein product [Polarella glacialis]
MMAAHSAYLRHLDAQSVAPVMNIRAILLHPAKAVWEPIGARRQHAQCFAKQRRCLVWDPMVPTYAYLWNLGAQSIAQRTITSATHLLLVKVASPTIGAQSRHALSHAMLQRSRVPKRTAVISVNYWNLAAPSHALKTNINAIQHRHLKATLAAAGALQSHAQKVAMPRKRFHARKRKAATHVSPKKKDAPSLVQKVSSSATCLQHMQVLWLAIGAQRHHALPPATTRKWCAQQQMAATLVQTGIKDAQLNVWKSSTHAIWQLLVRIAQAPIDAQTAHAP